MHFTYNWSGQNALVGVFSATNESTWEHLKLLAMPVLFWGAAEYFIYGSKLTNFIPVKALSILLGIGTIVVLFYTYVGVVGHHFLWADIATFVVGVAVAYCFSAHFLATNSFSGACSIRLGWLALLLLVTGFALFSFFPPHIGLFFDPVSHHYGKK